jgi:hypothetical protein
LELSGEIVPENEHPELAPLTLPLELIVTVVVVPSSKVPVQVPVMLERDAAALYVKLDGGSDVPVKVIGAPISVSVPFKLVAGT